MALLTTETGRYFSPDYARARHRFRESVDAAGGKLESLPLTARGPEGEDLTIDVAWFGLVAPRSVLLHSSGLHGVEGFAGSAIQLRLVEGLPSLSENTALVFAHVLNPYGMAWLRRVNENNVDLNRNFLPDGETYRGRPDGYDALYSFLNPPRLPAVDVFALRAAWLLLRHGRTRIAASIVGGQYDYPEGLFFGGHQLEEDPRRYRDFLARRVSTAERVFAIDIHTGLGPFGEDTILVETDADERLRKLIGPRVQNFVDDPGNVAYRIRGGLHEMVLRVNPEADTDFVGQEFGTCSQVRVLNALRKENLAHQHGAWSLDEPGNGSRRRDSGGGVTTGSLRRDARSSPKNARAGTSSWRLCNAPRGWNMRDFKAYVRRNLPDLGLPADKEARIVEQLAAQLESAYEDLLAEGLSDVWPYPALEILPAALLTSRFIERFLWGIEPHDTLTMTVATVTLLLAVLLAAYIPAWRASRIDPTVALRHE